MPTFVTILYLLSPTGLELTPVGEYSSAMRCGEALLEVNIPPGWSGHCEETRLLSESRRPEARGDTP